MRRTYMIAAAAFLCGEALVAQPQQSAPFAWSSPVSRGSLVRIRNVRGDISVLPSTSGVVEVVAEKVWRRGNPALVRIFARRVGESVLVCTLIGAASDCDSPISASDSRAAGDVAVHYAIKVPSGMRLSVNTVNGDVSIETASRVLIAETVNGNVVVHSSEGSVAASAVNGTVTAILAEPVHATLDIRSRGRLHSDFPLQVTHAMRAGRLQALIGRGGRRIELATVWGDVWVRAKRGA